MKKTKKNNCVELKNKIQQSLYSKYKGLTDEEREKIIFENLATSHSAIAKFWKRHALSLADEKVDYKSKKPNSR